ncbi:flavin monoamine oxidase family protein [Candidatus Viadribacter manganicus]|uniref:Tryptophan 2-monooxygenase n=1 Tax=Candidatus Viadribacter manganicus TaxID=1759059 RepID=A0A1B1ALP0_9PROT|nr:NAD(P)/FAD-dependent oxidoreductase [Candidatus Viadribacter manganicus]ANP47486.1 hypothetical protein ATE48_17005 [Candidatus Viadribacter manganicus]
MRDVAIIGGGVSGCYCAYRLSASKHEEVALYEASERIGGRLWSTPVKGAQLPAEIGGMFFRALQKNVSALVEHLALPSEPVQFSRVGQFVRGRWLPESDFSVSDFPFALDPKARGGGPAAVLLYALEQIVPGATDMWPVNRDPPRSANRTFDWLRTQRHNGRPLEVFSLWSVFVDAIGNEAHALLISTLGTSALFRNLNAFDGIWSILHEIGDGQGFRLRDGYQQLPEELARRAMDAGVFLARSHRLLSVARAGDGFELAFATEREERRVEYARRVVLALPQRALQLIAMAPDLFEDAAIFKHVRDRAVAPIRSCKIFLSYERAWWSGANGPTQISARYTDLPMQQCYHFAKAAPEDTALLMGAYADDGLANFWGPLNESGASFASASADEADAQALVASEAMVASLRSQLATVHAVANTPRPEGALYFDWGADPYGAAWHAWTPNMQSWKIRPWMRQPNPNLDLYICGEAYAQRNGWVEGAINSAERILERLGLSRPVWITDPDFQFEIDDGGVEHDDCNHADVQRDVSGHVAAA